MLQGLFILKSFSTLVIRAFELEINKSIEGKSVDSPENYSTIPITLFGTRVVVCYPWFNAFKAKQ
jgi:hypothetical protein